MFLTSAMQAITFMAPIPLVRLVNRVNGGLTTASNVETTLQTLLFCCGVITGCNNLYLVSEGHLTVICVSSTTLSDSRIDVHMEPHHVVRTCDWNSGTLVKRE